MYLYSSHWSHSSNMSSSSCLVAPLMAEAGAPSSVHKRQERAYETGAPARKATRQTFQGKGMTPLLQHGAIALRALNKN